MRCAVHLLLCLAAVLVPPLRAATHTAASPALADVQAAVNLCAPGDTVNVPAGSNIWTGTLTITNDINVIGSGIGLTIITNDVAANLVNWQTASNGGCRLSGIQFEAGPLDGSHSSSGSQNFYFHGFTPALRVDHCRFDYLQNLNDVVTMDDCVFGVFDHNTINLRYAGFIEVQMPAYGGVPYADGSWADADNWSSTNCLCFEDNVFYEDTNAAVFAAALGAQAGARVIFRNNFVTNCWVGSHGTESDARVRSVRWLQIYGNTFCVPTNQPLYFPNFQEAVLFRGGTGVVYSNTVVGGFLHVGEVATYRAYPFNFTPWNNVSGANGYDSNNPTVYASGTLNGSTWTAAQTVNQTLTTNVYQDTNLNLAANAYVNYWLWDTNQNLGEQITANTSNTFTVLNACPSSYTTNISGAVVFLNGDHYQLRAPPYAALDMPGMGRSDLMSNAVPPSVWPHEVVEPICLWANTWIYQWPNNWYGHSYAAANDTLSANSFLTNTVMPGYTALIYPHPLVTTTNRSSGLPPVVTTNLVAVPGWIIVGPGTNISVYPYWR